MIISAKKSKVMNIHKTVRTSATTEADVAKLNLMHKCESCTREFTKQRAAWKSTWCVGETGVVRTDKAVKLSMRRAAEYGSTRWSSSATRHWKTRPISNIWAAGCKATGATRQTWVIDWRSRNRRLAHWATCGPTTTIANYDTAAVPGLVCSSRTPYCDAWTLNRTVTRSINWFNSRCLQAMTGEHYRETATVLAYDLVLSVRWRRLRYFSCVLHMPADRMVRCALIALMSDSVMYQTGSLFSDCHCIALPQCVAMTANREMWRATVASLSWTCVFKVIYCTTIVP